MCERNSNRQDYMHPEIEIVTICAGKRILDGSVDDGKPGGSDHLVKEDDFIGDGKSFGNL